MYIQDVLIVLVGSLVAWILFQKFRLFRKMAPGPYGIPFVGSMIHLLNNDAIDEFQKYKKKYGKVFSLSAGDFYITVVTDYRLIIENMKKDEFQGRPDFVIWKERNLGKRNRGILVSDSPVWHEQRRFVLRGLRDFGKVSLEEMLINELRDLQATLRKEMDHPINLCGVFNASVLNSLWFIVTGKRFELDDPKLKSLITLLIEIFIWYLEVILSTDGCIAILLFHSNVQGVPLITPALFFYAPVKYGLIGRKQLKSSLKFRAELRQLMDGVINEHFERYEEGDIRDFMDAYIQQIKESSSKESSFYSEEGRSNLYAVLVDLFLAGAETTSTTLQWAALYLCHHPEVQRKAQEEIDNVIGRSRPPNKADKSKLIYLEAVLNEVHRMSSLVPFSVFHTATQDSHIGRSFIPKNSIIFFSIYDAHHDEEVWGDANNFRPERFLDKTGTKVVKHEALIPFSSGKRQCLGESLARDTLFIFLSGLLQAFTLEFDPESRNTDLRGSSTFISSPKPFKVIIKERL